MTKKIFLLLSFFIICYTAISQATWINVEDLQTEFILERRPILVFIYTDWCKVCKIQDETVFKNDTISELVEKNYYAIRINAESQEKYSFFNREYDGSNGSSYNQLAVYLGSRRGKMSFPTTTILNENLDVVFKETSKLSLMEMKTVLNAVVSN